MEAYKKLRGRGSHRNISSRFHSEKLELDDFEEGEEGASAYTLKTEFIFDSSKTILSKNSSPDLGFDFSINPYRGCEHGCSYCYARPSHEYLGHSAGLDFESKIYVKMQSPQLLSKELSKKSWIPQVVVLSGNTDCYQPPEKKFGLTRACLKVFSDFKNPVGLITKNALICRDIDILSSLANENLAHVTLSITTLNAELARKLEPRTSTPESRLQSIRKLSEAGIPVSVNVAPIIPGLTDHEVPSILEAASQAGARHAGYTMLRLPYSVRDIFTQWLERHYPEKKNKVLGALYDVREGRLNQTEFGDRMRGNGKRAEAIAMSFRIFKKKFGLNNPYKPLATHLFHVPTTQMSLF